MKTVLIHHDVKGAIEFQSILETTLIEFRVINSLESFNATEVDVLIFWLNIPEYINHLSNLKLILSCGSGIDHFIHSVNIPNSIPIIRLVDPYLKNRVANYVLKNILEHKFPSFDQFDLKESKELIYNLIKEKRTRVGIMGLGLIGESVAKFLIEYGFTVYGWVNIKKKRSISNIFIGKCELYEFVQKSDVLVCQLPLTRETKGILDINLFNYMPKDSYLINTGRGEHLNEYDLITAIESGNLSGACLDVLTDNKSNEICPLYSNPKIKITPHIAGYVGPNTQAPYASSVIKNYFNKKFVEGIVDYQLKY
jgi:glyoxylate/hydroxypyruvate reductase A